MAEPFRAFVIEKNGEQFQAEVRQLRRDDLSAGGVVIRVAYSGVNYKDGLACIPTGQVARKSPLVPGIDLAGIVEASDDPRFAVGAAVLATSYRLGTAHDGGYSEYARVPAEWVVALPEGLTAREAMALGTAGFTAALALHRLEANGVRPDRGPILVTGATGGVGSIAVALLAKRGYTVAASTGKTDAADYLRQLGASEILSRAEVASDSSKPLEKERWGGVIDSVGGTTLAQALRTTRYGGSVAAIGLTESGNLATTVFPFILRGVNLLGIDSVECPMPLRQHIWQRLATDLHPDHLDIIIAQEIGLDGIVATTTAILKGEIQGRVLVVPGK
ncbi:MAG: oxidoreductase [Ktedonobacterales bacterium]|nr:oxidoreductase [Ktedonobacterales bacterium]